MKFEAYDQQTILARYDVGENNVLRSAIAARLVRAASSAQAMGPGDARALGDFLCTVDRGRIEFTVARDVLKLLATSLEEVLPDVPGDHMAVAGNMLADMQKEVSSHRFQDQMSTVDTVEDFLRATDGL